ncbi:MAG: aminoacyl-tRNA hydrolase [Parcubacteria group bacterium]
MKLILGLGNPGAKYLGTRHNIGFATLDFIYNEWLKEQCFTVWSENNKFQALVSEGNLNNEKIILAKPTTFMNNSGIAAQAIASYYKIEPEDIIIIHDELDVPFGELKIQKGHSSAGHNGVNSIIEHLGAQDFTRIRIGVGKADRKQIGDAAEFVLKKFSLFEKLKMKDLQKKVLAEFKKLF